MAWRGAGTVSVTFSDADHPDRESQSAEADTGSSVDTGSAETEQQTKLGLPPTPPQLTPIERSYEAFTAALARTLVCAQYTPPSRTAPGSVSEFEAIQAQLGVSVDSGIPPTTGEQGNLLEGKRMLLRSIVKWNEFWGSSLPPGVEKALLYRDMMRRISCHARELVHHDNNLRAAKRVNEVFQYRESEWKAIMEQDLGQSQWESQEAT
ncbi:hypothetical protein V5O48_006118 [Marasmius crinis-equi]|uniref:Uncharacterized protein n=1 Tax=Marasmius crinis-equi TaxID=585013 RepID=A0ABR3FKE6_9AGAR